MTRQTRTLTYGCMPPVEGNDLVREQMRAGHRYYNDLVALERARRAAYREVRSAAFPEIAGIEERTAILAKEIVRLRAAEASNDEARTLRSELREAQRLLSASKKAVRVDAGLTLLIPTSASRMVG